MPKAKKILTTTLTLLTGGLFAGMVILNVQHANIMKGAQNLDSTKHAESIFRQSVLICLAVMAFGLVMAGGFEVIQAFKNNHVLSGEIRGKLKNGAMMRAQGTPGFTRAMVVWDDLPCINVENPKNSHYSKEEFENNTARRGINDLRRFFPRVEEEIPLDNVKRTGFEGRYKYDRQDPDYEEPFVSEGEIGSYFMRIKVIEYEYGDMDCNWLKCKYIDIPQDKNDHIFLNQEPIDIQERMRIGKLPYMEITLFRRGPNGSENCGMVILKTKDGCKITAKDGRLIETITMETEAEEAWRKKDVFILDHIHELKRAVNDERQEVVQKERDRARGILEL